MFWHILQKFIQRTEWIPAPFSFVYEVEPICVPMYGAEPNAALAVGEQLYSLYKYNQAGMPPTSIPDLCTYFDIDKTKMYELLQGGKYKYVTKEEGEAEKKPLKRIKPEKIEEAPQEKKIKAAPTT